jgi:hypothetical protein
MGKPDFEVRLDKESAVFCLKGRDEITGFLMSDDAKKLEFEAPWPSLYFQDEDIDDMYFSFNAHEYLVKIGVPKPMISNEIRMAVTRRKYTRKLKAAAQALTLAHFNKQRFVYRCMWLMMIVHFNKIVKLMEYCRNDRNCKDNFEAYPIVVLYVYFSCCCK